MTLVPYSLQRFNEPKAAAPIGQKCRLISTLSVVKLDMGINDCRKYLLSLTAQEAICSSPLFGKC